MYLIYFDESGQTGSKLDDQEQPIFILAALITDEKNWLLAEDLLLKMIDSYFPDRPEDLEIHAVELRNGDGYFRDVPSVKRMEFRDKCFKLLNDCGFRLVYRGIEKRRLKVWVDRELGSGVSLNPHVVAFPLVARVVNDYLVSKGTDCLGIFISDENREVTADIEKSLRILRGAEGVLRLDRVIEKGFFIDSQKSLLLQMADLCAYYARKKFEQDNGKKIKIPDEEGVRNLEVLIHNGNEAFQDTMDWLIDLKKKGRPGENPKVS